MLTWHFLLFSPSPTHLFTSFLLLSNTSIRFNSLQITLIMFGGDQQLPAIEWRHVEYGTVPAENDAITDSIAALPAPPFYPQSYLPSSSSASQASVVESIFSLFSTSSGNRCEFADVEFRWSNSNRINSSDTDDDQDQDDDDLDCNGEHIESVWAHSFVLYRSQRWATRLQSVPIPVHSQVDTDQPCHRVVMVPRGVRRRTLLRELCMWYGGSIMQEHFSHMTAELQRRRLQQIEQAERAMARGSNTDFAFFSTNQPSDLTLSTSPSSSTILSSSPLSLSSSSFGLKGLSASTELLLLEDADAIENQIESDFIEDVFGRPTLPLYDFVLSLLEHTAPGTDAWIRIPALQPTKLEQSLESMIGGAQVAATVSLDRSTHDIEIPIHRAIVCKRCPWFAKTLSSASGFLQSKVVELQASESAIKSILRYLFINNLIQIDQLTN